MIKPKIFVTRRLPKPAMDRLSEHFDITVNPNDRVLSKGEIIDGVKGKNALLCLLTDTIDSDVMESNPDLQVISNYAVGYNNIDIDAATLKKMLVCYTPGVLTETTADLTWALILAVARRIVESDLFTRKGRFKGWGPELFLGSDVYGKTLGIIGMGRIGMAVARRAAGFGMRILYNKREPLPSHEEPGGASWCLLDRLLRESDIVTLHVPCYKETMHLIGTEELAMMKSSAILINTARGSIIDEKALVHALKTGQIAGVGLDVYEHEPKIEPELLDLASAVLLPHIGSATFETRAKMGIMAADNAIMVMQGKLPTATVNPQARR